MEKKHSEVVTVVIIDDHRLFNDGLKAMLAPEQTIEVLAQVYDSREASHAVRKIKPDVVLMDFNMPHLDGIELTKLLLGGNPGLKILILSMYNEERHIDSFKSIGARGYVFKTASAEEVVQAIRDVHTGGYHFPEAHAESNHADDNFLKKLKLSNCELEVIQLIKAELENKGNCRKAQHLVLHR